MIQAYVLPLLGVLGLIVSCSSVGTLPQLTSQCTFIGIYRLTIHPLAKYPGPKLWAITEWCHGLLYQTGRYHRELFFAHAKYGDIVRFGPNHLSFRTVEALHGIYGRKANVVKHMGFATANAYSNPPVATHSAIDPKAHAKRRRILAHAFSDTAIRNQEPFINANVNKWLRTVAELDAGPEKEPTWTTPKNMATWNSLLTMDVITDLAFGKPFGGVDNGQHWLPDMLINGVRLTARVGSLPIRELLYPIMRQKWLMNAIGGEM
jgi:cytochrome P450